MTEQSIRAAIDALGKQEAAIQDEFQKLEARLSQLRNAKAALVALENDEPIEFDGKLADACRIVLKNVGKRSLAPTEVRDALKALGYDLNKHTNVMASIHSVLKRLAEGAEVETKEWKQAPGQRRYYWVANFIEAAPAESLHIQDTINASMDAANRIIQNRRDKLDRLAAVVFSSAPPTVVIEKSKKKEGK